MDERETDSVREEPLRWRHAAYLIPVLVLVVLTLLAVTWWPGALDKAEVPPGIFQ